MDDMAKNFNKRRAASMMLSTNTFTLPTKYSIHPLKSATWYWKFDADLTEMRV